MAVSAAYTYLLANPRHETMKKNIEFYRTLHTVKPSYFYNREAKPYQVPFNQNISINK